MDYKRSFPPSIQYSQITFKSLKNACVSWQVQGEMANSCSTQNNEQMQKCIMNTLTEQACLQVMIFQGMYTTEEEIAHLPLLYKTIMRISTNENIAAAAAVLRDNLQNLDEKMVELNSNLPEFYF